MATPGYTYFDPNRGYVPSAAGGPNAPLAGYNANYDPITGKQNPTGGVGANPYPFFRYGYSGPGMDVWGSPTNELHQGYPTYTGDAIDKMAQNDRDLAVTGGAQLGNDLNNYTKYQYGRAADLGDQLTSAWGPTAQGQGGYTDAQKEAILNNPALQALKLSPEQAQSNYLSGDEQAGITGNPYAAVNYLSGQGQGLQDKNNMWANQVGAGLGSQEASINDTLRGTGNALTGSTSQLRGDQFGNLSNIAALTRGYVNPNTLNASSDFMRNYNVTPQDVQNIRDRAGRQVGSQEAMDEENLAQQANAQGNSSPLAMQAARDRMRRTGAINQAGAMTDAEIAARKLQLDTTQGREAMRLGAAQNYANLGTSNEQFMGANTLNTTNQVDQAALDAEKYYASTAIPAQEYLGNSRVSNLQQLGQRDAQTGEYLTGLGVPTYQQAEQAQSSRAGTLAGNRQATNQYNQGQDFTRGQFVYGAGATANKGFADTQRADEQGYRGYLADQQTQANQGVQVGNQQKTAAFGATNTGAQGATSNAIKNYGIPGQWQAIAGTVNSFLPHAKGGVTEGPHMGLIGEAGPELLIDLKKLPRYGTGYNPFSQDSGMEDLGDSGSGEVDQEGHALPTGDVVKKGQDVTRPNPIYKAIRSYVLGNQTPTQPAANTNSDTDDGGTGINPATLALIGKAGRSHGGVGGLMSMFGLAGGGVIPGMPNQHHPYGKRGESKLKQEMGGMPMVHAELITKPTIRPLGVKGPQAILPLTPRKSNKVTPGMLPKLVQRYGRV